MAKGDRGDLEGSAKEELWERKETTKKGEEAVDFWMSQSRQTPMVA